MSCVCGNSGVFVQSLLHLFIRSFVCQIIVILGPPGLQPFPSTTCQHGFWRISRLFKLENELESNCCQSRLNWFAFAATRRLLRSTSPSSDESSPPTFFGVSGTSGFTFHFAFYLNLQSVCLAGDDNKQRKKRWLCRLLVTLVFIVGHK